MSSRGQLAPAVHIVADQVGHHRIAVARRVAERPAGNGAHVVLELADEAGVDGPVAGIVHSGRDLVDEQARNFVPRRLAPALKHLDAEHADMAERLGDLAGDAPRLFGAIVIGCGRARG